MAKREISPWVWIGASCAVLVLGIGGLIVGGGYLITREMREARERAREQVREEVLEQSRNAEELFRAAEEKARGNPDLVVVSRDPARRTITFRHARTGERIVLEQKGNDQVRVVVEEGEAVLAFPRGHALGSGDAAFLLGTDAGAAVPSWVPRYPGAELHPIYAFSGPAGASSGSFISVSPDRLGPVIAFYYERLERLGFQAREEAGGIVSVTHPDGRSFTAFTASLSSHKEAGGIRLQVIYAGNSAPAGPPGNR